MLEYKIDVSRFNETFSPALRRAVAWRVKRALAGSEGSFFESYWNRLGTAIERDKNLPLGIPHIDDLFPPNIAVLDWLMETGIASEHAIVDAPCGLGNLMMYLNRLGYKYVYGYDNWQQIEECKARKFFQMSDMNEGWLLDLSDLLETGVSVLICVGLPWKFMYEDTKSLIPHIRFLLIDSVYAPIGEIEGFKLIGKYEGLLNVYKNNLVDSQLHLGCGKRHIDGFTHVDLADFSHIDYRHDVRTLPMADDNSVETIYACHVLEYFDREEVESILEEWNRTLVPDGTLRVAVPDFEALIKAYKRFGQLDLIHGPLYGRWKVGNRVLYHRTVYDFATLRETLKSAGFYEVCKYDWRETIHRDYDDYSQAYLPHMDKEEGLLISLNVECKKLFTPQVLSTCCT